MDQNSRVSYFSVHGKFRFHGDIAEFYRLEPCSDTVVIIPDSFMGKPVCRIAGDAFNRCRELEEVVIPDSVESIGAAAFYICPKLNKVTLPKNLRVLENSAFNYCRSLRNVRLPEGTERIGRRAFYDCSRLELLFVPSTVELIGEEAFANCELLEVVVEEGSYAEAYCKQNKVPYTVK